MMEVIIVKYVQLICLTIFMGGNYNCATLMSRTEEMKNLKVTACAARCLKTDGNNSLNECYQQCANLTESLPEVTTVQPTLNAATFRLYCRDSKRLLIKFDKSSDGHVENEKFIYMLIIQETRISFVDRLVYISNEPLIELHDLKPSESYNISATIVASNDDVHFLGTKVFTTLNRDYKPSNITHIWVEEFEAIKGDGDHLNVLVGWNPANDQTCLYEFIFHGHSSDSDIKQVEIAEDHLYYHWIESLKFNELYNVAVRGVNTEFKHYPKIESGTVWENFTTPSCRNFTELIGLCGPERIDSFQVSFEHVEGDTWSINVSWARPIYDPKFYSLHINEFFPLEKVRKQREVSTFTIESYKTSVFIPALKFTGSNAFFRLKAHFNNRTTDDFTSRPIYHVKRHEVNNHRSNAVFYSLVGVMAVGLIVFGIYMLQLFNNFKKKQSSCMSPDLINSITNRTMKEAIDDQTRDTAMEIERSNIELSGVTLGEGAFGLVKHAVLIRDGRKCEVAVKMLKNITNIEDIKQFNQEISVMKSVGKHPNIVSIVGHCTMNIHDLMLLTEFCDEGNLLNFLINEAKKQVRFYVHDKKPLFAPAMIQQKYLDSLNNFDGGRKEFLNNKVGYEPQTSVSNPMYDDLNNNSKIESQAVGLTAVTNALYLGLGDNESKPVVIDIEKSEAHQDFLTSDNLIEFARQVSDGMDFLAKKKVVHRDLAARNILVCSDKTVKISDFGLSRDIYQDKIYRKKGHGKLPLKWLAIESITHNEYTSKSDVWSFGILLYEIVTLGESPYPSLGFEALERFLKSGQRMEKPDHCHERLYNVMIDCWRENPVERPSFEVLSCKLKQFQQLSGVGNKPFIDLLKLHQNKYSKEANYLTLLA